ncbi:maestro heat-like repeat-containing protein family member 9 [Passer domesticus]|uniref:maestro heat-like repeat-containing protein family member 9 n=1 Tax=Passer domesticus TaxID=48849 RepID=UPI0030FEE6C9
MEQRPPRLPKLAWVQEEEEGPGAAPAQQKEEVVTFKPLQKDAAVERTQEQQSSRGLFHRTAQLVCKLIKRIREEETSTVGTGLRAYSHIFKTKTSAALLDMLVEEGFCNPKQVPAVVRYIHQWLTANQFAEHRLNRTLLDLTEAQPADVLVTLLRVAPSCDRAALTMWKSIMCSPRTAEPALLILLDVLGSWPEHSMCTSDGDKTGVLVLAATVVMWKILQVPCVPHMVTVYFPRLFVHLLFQVFFTTLDMPEEVDTFWKGCQEQYDLAASPNRFAVRTLKSLLCRMQHEDVVVAMEAPACGWDTLLCADTHHYAVALLAREMSCVSISLCSRIARYLLRLLSTQEPRWELPALAFLAEVSLMASAASQLSALS